MSGRMAGESSFRDKTRRVCAMEHCADPRHQKLAAEVILQLARLKLELARSTLIIAESQKVTREAWATLRGISRAMPGVWSPPTPGQSLASGNNNGQGGWQCTD
jgi:hypothetical protein